MPAEVRCGKKQDKTLWLFPALHPCCPCGQALFPREGAYGSKGKAFLMHKPQDHKGIGKVPRLAFISKKTDKIINLVDFSGFYMLVSYQKISRMVCNLSIDSTIAEARKKPKFLYLLKLL